MTYNPEPTPQVKTTPGTLLLGFVVFVLVPALITAIAPVSYLSLQKERDHVRASAKTCLLFFIPYQQQTVSPVRGTDEHVRADRQRTRDERRRNHGRNATVEGEGTLILMGDDNQSLKVSVTPVDIEAKKKLVEEYLQAPTDQPLNLFLVANWKFSVLMGGAAASLTVLYVVGCVLAAGRQILKLLGLVTSGTSPRRKQNRADEAAERNRDEDERFSAEDPREVR